MRPLVWKIQPSRALLRLIESGNEKRCIVHRAKADEACETDSSVMQQLSEDRLDQCLDVKRLTKVSVLRASISTQVSLALGMYDA